MRPTGEPPPAQPGGVQPAGGLTVEEEVGREGVTGLKRCRKLQVLPPGSAISEGAVRGRLRMFAFDSRVSTRTRTVTDDLCGCIGRAVISPDPVSK